MQDFDNSVFHHHVISLTSKARFIVAKLFHMFHNIARRRRLLLMLHGGLGDQLSMYFGARELAKVSNRELVISKWTIGKTHVGSPYGLLDLIPKDISIEYHQGFTSKKLMYLYRRIIGFLRPRLKEDSFFHRRVLFDRLFGIINNVISFDYDTADPSFVFQEIKRLKHRRVVRLNSYFPSFADSGDQDLHIALPGLFNKSHIIHESEYAVVHFRVGDIFDTYSTRGVLGGKYYELCVERILISEPGLKIFAVSDNIERAKMLYGHLPLIWIDDSDTYDALSVLKILANSKMLVTANSGLSFWAGKLGLSISEVLSPAYPTKKDLLTGTTYPPLRSNWFLIQNDFI